MSEKENQQVAIVTGAGQGIGFAICRELLKQGVAVVLNDLNVTLTNQATAQLKEEFGANCIGLPGNAADVSFINNLILTAKEHFGQVTIAIANAGITLFGDFFTYTPEAFQQVMDLNLKGSFFLAQAIAKQIQVQQTGGSILFMSSVTGHQAHKNLAAYGMTKAALEMLAKNLVIEVSAYGITVNAIAPGATLTERTALDADYERTWSNITPLGRPASPEDIAQAAVFLVSEKARHITGQTIIIDGGWTSISPSPY
ncbi:SDR family NAD(P)-dependent oxidoreductase [Adhaeribacter pallidiroseus]|uniref:Glucose 1-dehydrogenase (NAD(P)(+)) n=1 Tax=Adhaeribacter pallidiroseus TaxID=2072847 RepID=A0A369QGZ1_9BACT|nr:SDR family oxidoreductase [Adhaeribacter pallidiroseus]RDC62835.1 Glucose 1-dehydrogenase (NAD(P)(+)) [Adhaeribacter pallidiroseus]